MSGGLQKRFKGRYVALLNLIFFSYNRGRSGMRDQRPRDFKAKPRCMYRSLEYFLYFMSPYIGIQMLGLSFKNGHIENQVSFSRAAGNPSSARGLTQYL